MKVVHIIDKLVVGGAQRLLITFAQQLQHTDVDLTVILLWDNPYKHFVDELISLGVTVEIIAGKRSSDIGRLVRLVRYIRQQQFELICSHLFQAGILGALAGWLTRTPVISTVHNVSLPNGLLRSFVWKKSVAWGSYSVIAVGTAVADEHKNWLGSTRFETFPNPVAPLKKALPSEVADLRIQLTGSDECTLILAVGIISPQKGYDDLVEAMRTVCENDKHVFLAIAGGGREPGVSALQDKINAFGLGERVLLLGMRDDISQLLSAADLFVSSSHWEGLPVAVLEAMSAGLPVVATSVGDLPQVIVEGTGVLVPAQRPDLLSSAIVRLIGDSNLREQLGSAAREQVTLHHSPAHWVAQHLELYSKAIAFKHNKSNTTPGHYK